MSTRNRIEIRGGYAMLKRLLLAAVFGLFLVSCATMPNGQATPQEVIVKVQATDPTNVKVAHKDDDENDEC